MSMKLVLVVGLSLTVSTYAMSQSLTTLRVGITAGINAANVKNAFGYHDLLWRYNVGISLDKRLSTSFALMGNILYSRQGNANRATVGTPARKTVELITFDYITLPLLMRFRPRGEPIFIEAGGQIGYLLTNNYIFIDPLSTPFGGTFDPTNKIDAGLVGGLGYRVGQHLVIDGRYYYGLRSVTADQTLFDPQTGRPLPFRRDKIYNRVLSVNLSYYF